MRLTKLKIAGFKSFVDPTTVLFPGQLAGVVGPNGCGKSNIIDAVRWVLGESKASELRGESLQDVIFKGSGTRKEVSRASVELFFDNQLGRIGGQWGQYGEITVKRVLDREGNSNYFINNLNVRRRDVIDLFLGTGLGPRAYAIIGQGMISRIIEARPEELRFFLEEAAGVTKYKERRKETQHRLEDAAENLARLDDIRGELSGQIVRLEAQAEVARRYKSLQGLCTRKQQLLWLKRRNDARVESERLRAAYDEAVNRLEAETTDLRSNEARVEAAREAHFAASDAVHAAQGEMYTANTEVARLEAEIGHIRESRHRLEQRLTQLNSEQNHWQNQSAELAADELRWQTMQENAELRLETLAARHEEALDRLPQLEAAVADCAGGLVETRRRLAEAEQGARLAETERGHAQRTLDNLAQRREKLRQERAALEQPDSVRLAAAEETRERLEEALALVQEQVADLQQQVPQAEAMLAAARQALQQAQRELTEVTARHGALCQLQDKVQQRGQLSDWLKQQGLAQARPLWQSLHVEPGWETALEAVLREKLSALSASAEQLPGLLISPPPNSLALRLSANEAVLAPVIAHSLRGKVRCLDAAWEPVLDCWLAGVQTCADIAQAIPEAGFPGYRWVDQKGHVRDQVGITLYSPDAATHGVLERQREIEALAEQIDTRQIALDAAQEAQEQAQQVLSEVQTGLTQARRNEQDARGHVHAVQVELLKLNQLQARFDERAGQIDGDLADISEHEETARAATLQADDSAMHWLEQQETAQAALDEVQETQRQHDLALREARSQESQLGRELQEAGFSQREAQSRLEDNARNNETARAQLARITQALDSVQIDLERSDDDALMDQLQEALVSKQAGEGALVACRNGLEGAAAALRALDEARMRLEQGLAPLRNAISEVQLKQQAAQINEAQYQQRLDEAEADEASLQEELQPGLRESAMQGEITRLANEMDALGAVNLAALEELEAAQKRQSYLDAQSADLTLAINTLEDAIRRIDRETRTQLQDTYDTVNRHFGALFPELFGGGEARLILTGDEILDAGIQIMARPPGKKNSTIYLLSGGEKALTAIALVFAMFQLNPAPFCMLDEVDAPLDDSNTERFAEMVKRMSVQTQFIFISHNKIAMEMATHLIGVTMQERGVSRVVEVDMEEALRLTVEKDA